MESRAKQHWPLTSALLNLKSRYLLSTIFGLKTGNPKFIHNLNRGSNNHHACEYRKSLTFAPLLDVINRRAAWGRFPTPFFLTAAIDRSTMSRGKEKSLSLQPLPSATIFLLVWCGCAFHPHHFFDDEQSATAQPDEQTGGK